MIVSTGDPGITIESFVNVTVHNSETPFRRRAIQVHFFANRQKRVAIRSRCGGSGIHRVGEVRREDFAEGKINHLLSENIRLVVHFLLVDRFLIRNHREIIQLDWDVSVLIERDVNVLEERFGSRGSVRISGRRVVCARRWESRDVRFDCVAFCRRLT